MTKRLLSLFTLLCVVVLMSLMLAARPQKSEPASQMPPTAQEPAPLPEPEPVAAENTSTMYLENTFMAMRLKDFNAVEGAFEKFKAWVQAHPSVQTILGGYWEKIATTSLKQLAAEQFNEDEENLPDYFAGPVTYYFNSDLKWIEENRIPTLVAEFTTASPEKAAECVEDIKNEENVTDVTDVEEGIISFKMEMKEQNFPGPIDVFVTTVGPKLVVGTELEYLKAARNAIESGGGVTPPAFWSRAGEADVALWIDTRPVVAFIRGKFEQAANDPENEGPTIDPEVIDKLGLAEIEGLGIMATFDPFEVRIEIPYSQSPTGIAKLFGCSPAGLEPSSLVPADMREFSLGRTDIMCVWTQLRDLAKVVVPASDVMYTGWAKQMMERYGVNIDQQLFGAFGDRYITFERGESANPDATAFYLEVNDPVGLQGALDAMFKFFSDGKEFFNQEKIGETTVWRLKEEIQGGGAPSIAYAITSKWLIVSVGDPTQMQDLIEATTREPELPIFWDNPLVQEMISRPTATRFGYSSLSMVLREIAAGAREARREMMIEEEETDAVEEAAQAHEEEIPTFDDVKGFLVGVGEIRPGLMSATIKLSVEE